MPISCIIRPERKPGQKPELFDEIKSRISRKLGKDKESKKLAYETTWKLYGLAISSKFRQDHADTLKFDEDGFPILDSLLGNEYARSIMGEDLLNKMYADRFITRENTRGDYKLSLESALEFNKRHPDRIATVFENADGKLEVKVSPRTDSSLREFREQYAAYRISEETAKLLEPLGIRIGDIIGDEVRVRNGKIDFSKAKDVLDGVDSLIMVANNMKGARAIGHEMAHLLVGTRRDQPLTRRLLAALASNEEALRTLLGDEFEAEVEAQDGDMSKVAEEALGQLLHRHLVDGEIRKTLPDGNGTKEDEGAMGNIRKLFTRLRDFIVNKFRKKKLDTASRILEEAEKAMGDIASSVNAGTMKLTRKDIMRSHDNTVLNDLNAQMERNVKVLEEAVKTERKRYAITSSSERKNEIAETLDMLSAGLAPNADQMLTIYKYLEYATRELANQDASLRDFGKMDFQEKFQALRRIRSYVKSFDPMVKLLYEVSAENRMDEDPDTLAKKFSYNGNTVDVYKQLKELSLCMETLKGQFRRLVIPTYAEFLKPFVGEIRDNKGGIMDIEEMLKTQVGDISFLDRWLDGMGDSASQLLQSFDTVLRAQKDKARLKSLKDIRRIQALQKKAEEMGITSYEWMFEKYRDGKKTGNYISAVNYSQYYQDLKEFNDGLDRKYGKNVRDPEKRKAKLAEKQEWLDKHSTLNILGNYEPDTTLYRNQDYDRLSAAQKEILDDYLEMKDEFDALYPSDKVGTGAIQLRRDTVQRYIDMAKSPSTVFDSVKEAWKDALVNNEDDDQQYGDRTTKGLMDFDGRQFNVLPILYQNRLSNPEELSTDVFSAMTAYAISSNDYAYMNQVVDALEVGRSLVTDDIHQVAETTGGKSLVEEINVKGSKMRQRIMKGRTNLEDKLNEWFESQVYGKKLAEETEFSVPFLNEKVSTTKLTSWMLRMASNCQLSFNYLANLANVGTGVAMTNIDAVSGEFFDVKELAYADKEYARLLPSFVKELNARYKTGKLSLFCELFNVKYQFDQRGRETQRKSALARVFGKGIGFLGQDGGDHWLYSRIAIAMAKREKVKVPDGNGNYVEKSLWDALEIVDSPSGKGLKEMRLPEGTLNARDEAFNIGKFSRKVGKVSQGLFGIYNDEDRNAALRHSMGRLMLLYRNWMKPQFNKRFQKKQYNQTLEAYEEGYYRTMVNLVSDLAMGKFNLPRVWKTLDDHEKRNVYRGLFEIGQLIAVLALGNLVKGLPDDDDKDKWLWKLAEYMAVRERHELGNLVPSLIMTQELSSTLKSPTAVMGIVDDTLLWMSSLINPDDWEHELQSGPWKGHTKLYKRTMKLPVPILRWYQQIDKFTSEEGLESKINYYARTQY